MKNSNRRLILKNGIYGVLGSVIGQIISMCSSIIIARLMGAVGIGDYTYAITFSGLIFVILNFGLTGILGREIAQDKKSTFQYVSNALGIRLFISIPTSCLFSLVGAVVLGKINNVSMFIFASIYTGLTGIYSLLSEVFAANEKFDIVFVYNIFQKIIILGTTIVVLFLYKNMAILLFWESIALFLIVCFMYSHINHCISKIAIRFEKAFCKKFIKEAFPTVISSTAEYINLRSDMLLLGFFLDNEVVGIYSVATNIYIAASFVPLSFAKSSIPSFNREYAHNPKEAKKVYNDAIKTVLLFSLMVAVALIVLGKFIINILYGNEFNEAAVPLYILAISLLFMPLNRFAGYMLVSLKKQGLVARYTWIGAIFNIIANLFLIKFGGMLAVAATTLTTELLVAIGEMVQLRGIIKEMIHFQK